MKKNSVKILMLTLVVVGLGGCIKWPGKTTLIPSDSLPLANKETKTKEVDASPSAWPTPSTISKSAGNNGWTEVKSGSKQVKGITTARTVVTGNGWFATNMDKVDFTVFPGQTQEVEVKIYNKVNQPIQYAVKASENQSSSFPIKINGSSETTGSITNYGQGSFRLSTISSSDKVDFSTEVMVKVVANDKVVAEKTIKVRVHTVVNEMGVLDTNYDDRQSGNSTMSVKYRMNQAFGIKLVNRHNKLVRFTARVIGGEDRMVMTADKGGDIGVNEFWITSVRFTEKALNGLDEVTVEFTIKDTNNNELEKKLMVVKISE